MLGIVNSQVMGNTALTESRCLPLLMNQLDEKSDYLLHGSGYHGNHLDVVLRCAEHRRQTGADQCK